ncbi:MAG: cation efflux family transporter [Desulfobacterales bacterium]|nr:MAG: cation efflux family transporter [Desulfobacterales bacterium]
MAHGGSIKSIIYALCANAAIAMAKLVAAIITGSGAMMAESIHSAADSGNQLLLLFGIHHAKKPPSPDYPLGHGKAIFFWSFIVALILFSMGGLYSVYEGIHKLKHPEPLTAPVVAVGVLIFSIIAEGISMRGCLKEVNRTRGDKSLRQWFVDTRQSELLVVFGEDLAALLGLSMALVFVVVALITGNPVWDALGSISIGVLLIVIAIAIGWQVQSLLIGQGMDPDEEKRMRTFLEDRPEVAGVLNLLTLQLGNDVMVAVKAKMAKTDSAGEMVTRINQCEKDLKAAFPQVLWLFFEPDVKD